MKLLLRAVVLFPSLFAAVVTAAENSDNDCSSLHSCSSREGSTRGSALLQKSGHVVKEAAIVTESDRDTLGITCDEASWPDKDHGLVCGECKVLVNRFSSYYKTCKSYCKKVGRQCVGAWEEENDNCKVKYAMTCDQTVASSDAICECGAKIESSGPTCYGELSHLAASEGNGVGGTIRTGSLKKCQSECSKNSRCNSITVCPQWNGCWMKDRSFNGGEATVKKGRCKTYYKKPCGSNPTPSPTPVPVPTPPAGQKKIRVASYNLYWWNAFGQNPWKGQQVTDNIKSTLQPDVLGMQECDDPNLIQSRTGYSAASPFAGAQGISVKPGLFTVGDTGSRDLQATGKWGPRFVTWTQLTHTPTGRTFWHFNTHWCVHNGNGQTCNAEKRYVGAQNMLKTIREKAGNAPVIITGDFNAGMGEPGPQHFLQNGFSLAKNHWVDAIFYSTGDWQVSSTELGDAAGSDHKPLIAELGF